MVDMMLLDIAKLPTAENSAIHLALLRQCRDRARGDCRGNGIAGGWRAPGDHRRDSRGSQSCIAVDRSGRDGGALRPGHRSRPRCHRTRPPRPHSQPGVPGTGAGLRISIRRYRPCRPARVCPTFLGYVREDGRVGTRNYIAVVAASNCAAHTAELIAQSYQGETLPPNVDGVVAFPHGEGCGHAFGPDVDQLRRTLGGVLAHPNVSAAVILGLGCEVNQIDHYLGSQAPATAAAGRPDAAIERRHARRHGSGAARNRAASWNGRPPNIAPKRRRRRSCWG